MEYIYIYISYILTWRTWCATSVRADPRDQYQMVNSWGSTTTLFVKKTYLKGSLFPTTCKDILIKNILLA
jgi:hypothetical protein